MKNNITTAAAFALVLSCQIVMAGSITDTYTTGDTLTATKMNNIKTEVNDNDQRIADIEAGYVRGQGDLSNALTGTLTVGAGGTSVLGVSTLFTQELNVGDAILINGETGIVASITDDLNLVLDSAHTAGALDATAFSDNDLLTIQNGAGQNKLVIDKSGYFTRRIARASGGPHDIDQTDNGQIMSRVLTFNKLSDDTAIRIGYTDNFRTNTPLFAPNSCTWEIRVDDVSCPGGNLEYANYELIDNNNHRLGSIFGYCEGLTVGTHEIQVWVSSTPGTTSGADCYTGWNTTWTLEAEEVY